MDGRKLPNKAEHAADLMGGAIVAVTLNAAGEGDTAALLALRESGVRACMPEPEQGRRNWAGRCIE